jgi:AcrR family transcriptional regulator
MSISRFAAPRFGAGLDDILHVVTLNADSTDHRSQGRRNRNSEAVLEAVLSLFLEHNLHPHPKEIADRAGVSLRSVYRYLGDADLMRVGMDQIIQDRAPRGGGKWSVMLDVFSRRVLAGRRQCRAAG